MTDENHILHGFIGHGAFTIYILDSCSGYTAMATCNDEIDTLIKGVVELFNNTDGQYADLDPKSYLRRLLPIEARYGN